MRTLFFALSLILTACGDNLPAAHDSGVTDPTDGQDWIEERHIGDPGKPRVLMYTFENYWHHHAMIDLRQAVIDLHDTHGFTVIVTNHPLAINAKNLADIDVIVFYTSGIGLTLQGRADLEAWIRAGGGTVGWHSATATEQTWKFYQDHMGTGFASHAGGLWPATVKLSQTHPITAGLPDLQLTDEWYFFTEPPQNIPGAQMVMVLDESTLSPDFPALDKQGYHPIGWTNDSDGGRMFYSAIGHNEATFYDPEVLEILARSIEWAAHQL